MNPKGKEVLQERKKYYKQLFAKMSLEEKMGVLRDLPREDLSRLLAQFQADEDYEICQAIKVVLDERKSE